MEQHDGLLRAVRVASWRSGSVPRRSLPRRRSGPARGRPEDVARRRNDVSCDLETVPSGSLPAVDLRNGPQLERRIADGRLPVSLHEFLQLVVENNLDLHAARYDYAIAQVDVLRARSGQAARGTPSAPLPAALFAGAIGAGVSSTAALSPGGTGEPRFRHKGSCVVRAPRRFRSDVVRERQLRPPGQPAEHDECSRYGQGHLPSTVLQTRFQQELLRHELPVSFNLQRQDSTQAGLLFNPALTSFMALQVYQPLLNGFGLALTRRFVTLADNDRRIVREAFQRP